MTAISLPALDGRSALGFLAALGTVRLLTDQGLTGRLAWSNKDATAVLYSDTLTSTDDVVQVLADVVAAMPDDVVVPGGPPGLPPPGEAPDKLRLPPPELRELVTRLMTVSDPRIVQAWIGSLVTDLAVDDKGRSAHTLFGAFSGKQSMYTMLRLVTSIRARPESLREALVQWRRVDGVTGEYLDHQVLFDAADSPIGKSNERGVPGATWLALMSYPMIRTTSVDGQRPISTGWYRSGRRMRLRWPLWLEPLEPPAIQALWESPLLTDVARGEDVAVDKDRRLAPDLVRAARARHDRASANLNAIGVFSVQRAERRRIPGRNFAGVLAPSPTTAQAFAKGTTH